MIKWLKYGLPGLIAGFVIFWLLGDLLGRHNFFALIIGSISGANLWLWIAQRLGKINPTEPEKPVTLLSGNNR